MTTPNLAALCGAVALAFNLDPSRVSVSVAPCGAGFTFLVLVDGKSPTADVAAFVDGMFDGARKLAAMTATKGN